MTAGDHDATAHVYDYQTGELLDGYPSQTLIDASLAADPTGAVKAYRAGNGWYSLDADNAEQTSRMGFEVRTVFVTVE